MQVGVFGGTGPAGRGLAMRLADAGHDAVLGSRDADRAGQVAGELAASAPSLASRLSGAANAEIPGADLVVVATPWEGAVATVRPLADALAGKVVVSMANALAKEGREMLALVPPRGSVAGAVQAALPRSPVVAAFHHLPASEMADLGSALQADVLVCSDHQEATDAVVRLVGELRGLRGIDAGSLSQAAAIEAFTAVCITINIRHRAHSTVRIAGL